MEPRCEYLVNPGTWPYAARCKRAAVAETQEGRSLCEEHAQVELDLEEEDGR